MSKPTVLALAMTDEALAPLRLLCIKNKIRLRSIPNTDPSLSLTLGALCANESIEGEATEPLPEPILLLANMTDGELSQFINQMKVVKIKRPSLMAILTETNSQWTPLALWGELSAEREAFLKMQKESAHNHEHHHHHE